MLSFAPPKSKIMYYVFPCTWECVLRFSLYNMGALARSVVLISLLLISLPVSFVRYYLYIQMQSCCDKTSLEFSEKVFAVKTFFCTQQRDGHYGW